MEPSRIGVPIAFVGGGNMASAIIDGAVRAGVLDADRVVVADPNPEARARFAHAVPDLAAALAWLSERESVPGAGNFVLAVKPQMLSDVAAGAREAIDASDPRIVTSILAGMTTDAIARTLGVAWPIVRVMPNTPARVGLGMSAWCVGSLADERDADVATTLFAAVGETVQLDESLMDAFTAAAGSGPAYLFYLAEAMVAGATALGMDATEADRVVRQTLLGAATLLAEDDASPAMLRAAVTSKGGTTAAATSVLDEAQLMSIVGRAMEAARDRGRELSS